MPIDSSQPRPLAEFTDIIVKLAGHTAESAFTSDLRRRFGNELTSTFLSVASLQAKAQKKLGDGIWWVTPRSLQQSTPWQVARLKATWHADRGVLDLCCGIGGDAVQLARRGPVVAVDSDRLLVRMTQANLALRCGPSDIPKSHATVVCADARTIENDRDFFVHIDPDRRASESRTTRPDQYQPPWDDVVRIVDRAEGAVVKLAPAAKLDSTTSLRTHRAWISLQGSVREQSVLFGDAMQHDAGTRSAIAISSDGAAKSFVGTMGNEQPGQLDVPGEFLIDPDAAIRAAGLTESFAVTHGLSTVSGPSGFLTADELESDADPLKMAVIGRVIWKGSCDDRKLRRELRARNMFPHTIKVRGTDHDPSILSKRWRECGEQPITLWIGRTSSRRFAAITVPDSIV